MPRCRSSRNGTITRSPTTGGRAQARSDYGHTNASLLAAHGRRAFCEYMPVRQTQAETGRIYRKIAYGPLLDVFMLDMRSYRGPNGTTDTAMGPACRILGAAQCEWLKRELSHSNATWKIIAADMPLSVVSSDAVAQGDGVPVGRELEIAEILAFIKHAGVRNTVWITADMHYTAAHYYDPNRAVFQDFEPFWEFISGPLHAGTWAPGELDNTFGPQVMYQNGCSAEQGENLAPCFGLQFFGHVEIDGATEVMTVTLKDVNDRNLWSTRIEPKLLRWTRGPMVRIDSSRMRRRIRNNIRLSQMQPKPRTATRPRIKPMRLLFASAAMLLAAPPPIPRPSIRSIAPRSSLGSKFDFKVEFPGKLSPGQDQGDGQRRGLRHRVRQGGGPSSSARTARTSRRSCCAT